MAPKGEPEGEKRHGEPFVHPPSFPWSPQFSLFSLGYCFSLFSHPQAHLLPRCLGNRHLGSNLPKLSGQKWKIKYKGKRGVQLHQSPLTASPHIGKKACTRWRLELTCIDYTFLDLLSCSFIFNFS